MRRQLRAGIAMAVLVGMVGCENGSPGPGENCVGSGGVCIEPGAACGESMPYPCPGDQVCCVPAAPVHDAGGG